MSTAIDSLTGLDASAEAARTARREKWMRRISRMSGFLDILGLGFFVPLLRIAAGEAVRPQLRELWRTFAIPVLAMLLFLTAWGVLAPTVKTSLGVLPGPVQVWRQAETLWADHLAARAKRQAFYERQEKRNAAILAKNPGAQVRIRPYTGAPTYLDQIVTSLETVFTGFIIATVLAVPLGVMCGLSQTFNTAINPLVQIFKPVSPLAWLPIVTMVVSALYVSNDPIFPKSFVISAITVTLCSLWPTLINTATGVASIDRDLINVGRVLRLSWYGKIVKIVLPSSLPLIFTGLRLSLGVGWMVLIAAEMLAQNPGLGKFVWDEFQNGSSASLSRIMVAVFTIGAIGFLLDRIMLALQASVTYTSGR
jgi:nitrate/nitrite transport system permease protein